MKLAICGSRTITLSPEELHTYINKLYSERFLDPYAEDFIKIVSGGAKGVDLSAKIYSELYNIDYIEYLPDWDKFGKSAGYIRNKEIAKCADKLLLIWDGRSRGSNITKTLFEKLNKPIYQIVLEKV
ncbi:MAG TPA: hypothetical protein VI911_08985 [Patescibacteria group bacterium]|nr:MAG: hypothetical protein UR43_C0005G0035 [candidate division TM6 bacterium GW2011_GWF2_33_332]HLD91132.1 hypothetical protein [Patescibacteria group bacterium]